MRTLSPENYIPLSPVEYQILLVLADRPLYGSAIIQQCEIDSEQVISVGAGTMYPALKRLERFGCIQAASEDVKRIYELTVTGRHVFEQETDRLRRAVHLAEHRLAKIQA